MHLWRTRLWSRAFLNCVRRWETPRESRQYLAWLYADAREGAKAVAQSEHVLQMDPNFTGAYLMLAAGYELQDKWSQAISALENVKATYPHAYFAGIAYINAMSGNTS